MTDPNEPRRYRNHAEEIQASLDWADAQSRADGINRMVEEANTLASRLLALLAVLLLAVGVCIALAVLFRFAINSAEAMPLHIEGFR